MKVILYLLGLCVVHFFVGCQTEGRPSSRSGFNMPAQWRSSVNSTNSVLARWWLQFNNPNLNALVEEGLSNNLDIQIAHKRMELARVQARMVDFSSRPRLNASINGEKRRSNYIGLPFGDGYGDGTLYTVKDRHENSPLKNGENSAADQARKLLQAAIDSMPKKAAKLSAGKK